MRYDVLIVGQGLCGTWLSYWLHQLGGSCFVIDDHQANSASRVASGIINPVTGRRMAKTWLADELLPFAWDAYTQMGATIGTPLISASQILDFFAGPDRHQHFEKKAQLFEDYMHWPEDAQAWQGMLHYPFGYGIIAPAYQVAVQAMLAGWRQWLERQPCLLTAAYTPQHLQVTADGVSYEGISARHIIFCDGAAALRQPHFSRLPFAINKGEALVVSIPDLPSEYIFKKTNTITPWQDGLFWVGSSYQWDFSDDQPSVAFRRQMEAWLTGFLRIPYTVQHHSAALRPTTVERRPFVGLHPTQPQLGIFNGMGTKGVSLAPWFARQMAAHLLQGSAIMPEVDIRLRYARVLGEM